MFRTSLGAGDGAHEAGGAGAAARGLGGPTTYLGPKRGANPNDPIPNNLIYPEIPLDDCIWRKGIEKADAFTFNGAEMFHASCPNWPNAAMSFLSCNEIGLGYLLHSCRVSCSFSINWRVRVINLQLSRLSCWTWW